MFNLAINKSDSGVFGNARIKLTAWYLLIIMVISVSFSVAIYKELTSELDRVERAQRLRFERGLPEQFQIIPLPDIGNGLPRFFILDPDIVAETKNRLKIILAIIDFTILGTSAVAGYFLAGKTLKPIYEMVDEQKRFVADASHELRTPLTAIKTETEVALRDKNLGIKAAKNLLKSNLEEVDKMQTLSDYLLTLSRYQNINFKITFVSVNLAEIAQKAIEKVTPLAKTKKITIKKELEETEINGNEVALTELTIILLDNAIKYSHKEGDVIVRVKKERNSAVVEVRDFGVGIKASEIPYIFNRFYRADSSRTKEKVDGYGLGLAIAKSVVDLHSGKISVISSPGQGSSFIVKLPFKPRPINFLTKD